ncbi:aldo/keto reductase [Priestia koreensis]|uniref:aldo/keto reductase n=1 Tax=Priestia koreensis TaxID=284581 RepID=UPI00203F1608|nr:aldo/keto reductase [Priestia koreensis]MCM3005565.1 aldo/keto reductase [Priestia koreensis]
MTSKHLQDYTILHNGVHMPWFGLGVYKVEEGQTAVDSVRLAIQHGYRSIDTASFYKNEESVGKGIRESGIPREELFITTKVWNTEQGYDETLAAFDQSLTKLGLDYIDLYLIHWPVKETFKETWRALEKLYKDEKVRAIGVSNFNINHLERLLEDATVKPMVNQVEYHPLLSQEELHQYCKENGIQLEAWSPLMRGQLLENPVLLDIANKYSKSTAQIVLRWDLQNGVVTIPKSTKEQRIVENASIFDFQLTDDEMKRISNLNENKRSGTDPATFD